MAYSRDGRAQLHIAAQPEQQHRARYQTEGSRGAVKDRSGNGFPVVKLIGYNKPATLQVFIGTDMGRVAPHMFYQACKVSGKNSTPCIEKKIDGTIVIEVDFDPAKDMTITCDCVGILKERNVDVEHRFPDQSGTRNKKKSTRCRMVFRTTITHPDGSSDILQTSSHPIVCTQPPGVPEICKKSLSVCPSTGGMELFILGKNFLKDTRVVFQQNDSEPVWEETVQPDKEFLQQTHLVCIVPAYQRCDILEPVTVRLLVTSSGKTSEPHSFTYMPATNPVLQPAVGTSDISQSCLNLVSSGASPACIDLNGVFSKPSLSPNAGLILSGSARKSPTALLPGTPNHYLPVEPPHERLKKDNHPVRLWAPMPTTGDCTKTGTMKGRLDEHNKISGLKMMPPPPLLPISSRRDIYILPDANPDALATELKTEVPDETSRVPNQLSPEELKGIDLRMKPVATVVPMATVSDLLSTQSPSLATFRRFVSNPSDAPLPTQSGHSVEKYLSHIENPIATKVAGQATVATTPSGPVLRDLTLNKLCSSEKVVTSQFLFEQPSNSSLLTSTLSSGPTTTQKVPFVNTTAIPNIYSSTAPVIMEKKQQKSQPAAETTIQDSITSELLAVGLTTTVPGNEAKSKYQETPLSGLCSSQTLPSTLLNSVPNTVLPEFPSPVSSHAESLHVPTILNTIADTSRMIDSTSLIFTSSQEQSSKSLLSSTEVSHKSDEQLIENVVKHSTQSQTPSTGILQNQHNITILPPSTTSSNANLNISSPPRVISGHLLGVTDTQTTLLTETSDTRLSALVSSAIESQIVETNRQAHASEKLDFISTSGSIMKTISNENPSLDSQAQVALNDNVANQNAPPIHVQDIALNSALSTSPGSSFSMNTLSSAQSSAHITQQNVILNNPLTATFNEHVMNSHSREKSETLVLNPVNEQGLTIETHLHPSNSSHMIDPTISIKNIILEPKTISDATLTDACLNHTPEISRKKIITPSMEESNGCLSSTNCTSPVVMKTMMLRAPEINEAHVMSTAVEDVSLCAPATHSTSPIATKTIIFDSSSVVRDVLPNSVQQPIAVKTVLNVQPTDSHLLTSVPNVPLDTNKLDILVESTANKHILTSSEVQSSSINNLSAETTTCPPTNSISLTTQSLASILGSTIPPNLSSTASLDTQAAMFVPKPGQGEICTSIDANSMETTNITLTNPQTLHNPSSDIITSQPQTGRESSLLTMFSGNNETGAKSLESVPVVTTTCSSILDDQLSRIFGEPSAAGVHTLISSKQDSTVNHTPTLRNSISFPSSNCGSSQLIMSTSCSSLTPKISNVNTCSVQGQEQVKLINQVLMELGSGETAKAKVNENSAEKESKEKSNVQTSALAVSKLDVQTVSLQQQGNEREQKERSSASAPLPVPVTEIAASTQSPRPVQKKLEEGMVPQELTQMSESDLLSYINPSCFDQV